MTTPGQRRGPATTPAPMNATAAKLQVPLQSTTRRPVAASRHVLADATHVVTARSGRQRLVLVISHCPLCRSSHMHFAPVGFECARRGANCGRGSYVLHAPVVEVAA